MTNVIERRVGDLQPGDRVLHHDGTVAYVVVELLRESIVDGDLVARVKWADGGFDIRAWDGPQLDQVVQVTS